MSKVFTLAEEEDGITSLVAVCATVERAKAEAYKQRRAARAIGDIARMIGAPQ